jgi:hypothetical protein
MPKLGSTFGWLLFLALLCGVVAFVVGGMVAVTGPSPGVAQTNGAVFISALRSTAWLVLFIAALSIHQWRGLWLLIGAPAAFFWPAITLRFSLDFWLFVALVLAIAFVVLGAIMTRAPTRPQD